MKKGLIFVFLLMIMLFAAACSSNQPSNESNDQEGQVSGESEKIVFTGSDIGEKTVTVAEITELPAQEKEVVSVDSAGDESTFSIKGTLLTDILALIGKNQQDLSGIRLVAGDGYMIEVPHEVLAARDIYFAYEIDGDPLQEGTKPIRAIIPEERAMYWVRNLVEVEILEAREAQAIRKLFILESAAASMELQDYTYYESVDKAVRCGDLFAAETLNGTTDTAFMKASDGLEKNEKREVFEQGYLKITGEEVPAFVSPDIPKGMYVKDILWLSVADVGYLSAEEAYNALPLTTQEGQEGIALTDIFTEVLLENGSKYLFTADDGYAVEIEQTDIDKGLLFMNEAGQVRIVFDGLPKNTGIKGLLSIEAIE